MIEDDCYFVGVHVRLLTLCNIFITIGLFANCISLKSLSLSLERHMFDLNYYQFINVSFALALAKSIY